MSLRTQNLLSYCGLALALLIGSCESLRIGASTRLDPRPSVETCCAEKVAT
jgi:hypothetical protein